MPGRWPWRRPCRRQVPGPKVSRWQGGGRLGLEGPARAAPIRAPTGRPPGQAMVSAQPPAGGPQCAAAAAWPLSGQCHANSTPHKGDLNSNVELVGLFGAFKSPLLPPRVWEAQQAQCDGGSGLGHQLAADRNPP
jgi:hypothetical protein